MSDREASLIHALEFAKGAIEDAIYSEDGLDGPDGEAALTLINEVLGGRIVRDEHAGGPPPGGAAPQEDLGPEHEAHLSRFRRIAASIARWDQPGQNGATTVLSEREVISLARWIANDLRAAPQDAGRDAGGAPTQEAVHDALTTVGAYHLAGAVLLADQTGWEALRAALTGGRPAAEPTTPEARAAATKLDHIVAEHGCYCTDAEVEEVNGCSGHCISAEVEAVARSLRSPAAEPPDVREAVCRCGHTAKHHGWQSAITPCARCKCDLYQAGAPAEPGEREGET